MSRRTVVLFAGVLVLAGCFQAEAASDSVGPRDAAPDAAGDVPADAAKDVPNDAVSRDAVEDAFVEIPGDVAADAPSSDLVIPEDPSAMACWSCTSDEECHAGLKCLPVGASKHCLSNCRDEGDCPPSYICYAASITNKSCLPVSYSCPACANDERCDTGKVCDMTSGECKDGKAECGRCTYDFECADGMRCYKKGGSWSGVCVAGCSDSKPCADTTKFTCGANDKGVRICQPNDDETCATCPSDRPFPSDDGLSCWECWDSSQCDSSMGEFCNSATHECSADVGCSWFTCDDGSCRQCCQDSDCPGDTGPCSSNGYCENPCWGCGVSCVSPLPIMISIHGVLTCVQCETNSDCAGQGSGLCTCTGDPTYECREPDDSVCLPPVCQAPCSSDADCPPGPGNEVLACSRSIGGICYDPKGTCDDVRACCPGGSHCVDFLVSLRDALGTAGGLPGDAKAPACTCSDTVPCLGGRTCTATSGMCALPVIGATLCPGGVPPANVPEHLCIDVVEMLGSLLGGV